MGGTNRSFAARESDDDGYEELPDRYYDPNDTFGIATGFRGKPAPRIVRSPPTAAVPVLRRDTVRIGGREVQVTVPSRVFAPSVAVPQRTERVGTVNAPVVRRTVDTGEAERVKAEHAALEARKAEDAARAEAEREREVLEARRNAVRRIVEGLRESSVFSHCWLMSYHLALRAVADATEIVGLEQIERAIVNAREILAESARLNAEREAELRALEGSKIALRRKVLDAPAGIFIPARCIEPGRLVQEFLLEDIRHATSQGMLDDIERVLDATAQKYRDDVAAEEKRRADDKERQEAEARRELQDAKDALIFRIGKMRVDGIIDVLQASGYLARMDGAKLYTLSSIESDLNSAVDAYRRARTPADLSRLVPFPREERGGGATPRKKSRAGQGAPLSMITGRPLVNPEPPPPVIVTTAKTEMRAQVPPAEKKQRFTRSKAYVGPPVAAKQTATERSLADRIAALSDKTVKAVHDDRGNGLRWRYNTKARLANAAKNPAGKVHVEAFVNACEQASLAQAAK